MPWLLNLQETYDFHEREIGVISKSRSNREYTLIPIAHTTQNAHIEVTVTEDGHFQTATVIDKNDASTLIPTNVDSASRSGMAVFPYPLHDNLKYTAGDFVKYGGKIGKKNPYDVYMDQLKDWVNSRYSHRTVTAIYRYLKKGTLIEDLVKANVIFLDENEQLIERWNEKYEKIHGNRPSIFSVVTGKQESAFVRFSVRSPNKILEKPWRDKTLYDSYISYYSEKVGNEDVCFVTGEIKPTTEKHSNKIRHAADKAKLISGNDTSGFTFRGRFVNSVDVASISYQVSQKAHNALKWLIDKQGRIIDGRVFLIWRNNKTKLISPWESSISAGELVLVSTEETFAHAFSKAIDGYKSNLEENVKVNVLVIDSATTGRLGVLYYREMEQGYYFNKIKEWHTTCVWRHSYTENRDRKFFFGAPSTYDIALAAYGSHANEKLIKGLMERMLPCILDGRKIPLDIVRSAFSRASNPVAMESWEWEKTLSVTCALLNKEERLTVALDKNNTDRDYLFGRMLAVADVLERSAMRQDEKRATNAIRYMSAFSKHPLRTWTIIQEAIQPYQIRLGTRAIFFTKIIDEIASKMKTEDFNDKPLSGRYLLGLYSQRYDLYTKNDDKIKEEGE